MCLNSSLQRIGLFQCGFYTFLLNVSYVCVCSKDRLLLSQLTNTMHGRLALLAVRWRCGYSKTGLQKEGELHCEKFARAKEEKKSKRVNWVGGKGCHRSAD